MKKAMKRQSTISLTIRERMSWLGTSLGMAIGKTSSELYLSNDIMKGCSFWQR
jgi:hypothetical protein